MEFPTLDDGLAYASPVLPVMRPGRSNMIFGVLPGEIDSDAQLQTAEFGLCDPVAAHGWSVRFQDTDFEITIDEAKYWHDSLNVWGLVTNVGKGGIEHVALQGLVRDSRSRLVGVTPRSNVGHFSVGEAKEFFLWGSTWDATVADPYILLGDNEPYSLEIGVSLLDYYTVPGCRSLYPANWA
jgi:hypothetical protein